MWCRASRHLCRHLTFGEELTLKLLKCTETSNAICPAILVCNRWLHVTNELQQSLKQKVVKIKHKGKLRIEVQPPTSAMKSQSIILPGPERIRASAIVDSPKKLVQFPDDENHTVCDVLQTGLLKSRNGKCLGYRSSAKDAEYEWISYTEVVERAKYIGSGLVNLGLEPSQKSFVGICTKTRPEFLLAMLGISHFSMVVVPMYECLGVDIISYIISQVQLRVIFCEDFKVASLVMQNREKYPNLQHLILIDDSEEIEKLKISSMNVLTFKELEKMGKSKEQEPKKPKPEDLFCICYTSGTTGQPKGVIISHSNVMSSFASMSSVLGDIPKNGILLAYLPCAHIYEIINEIYCLFNGGQVGFFSGNTDNLLTDIKHLKPTVLPLVPKLMNRIYSAVKTKVGPNILKRYLLKVALHQKEKYLKRGIVTNDTIWDHLMFHEVQKVMGGNVEMIFSASAPISKEVMKFFRCASGCLVFEAYGLSEVGPATMTLLSEHDSGFVGPPLASNHIKLVSVPELFYDAANDVGEVCIRGPNVFHGYYKNAAENAIDSEGWHHTGDIGKWLPNGTLSIIDRKKHIFKLNQGEYIIPEKSENVYVQSHIISQAFVDGQVEQDYAIAVVVPDEPAFVKWAEEQGFKGLNYENLCKNENVRKCLLEHMLKFGKGKNLHSLQQVGNVYISPEPFTLENNLLTPTLKLKRPEARKYFEDAIKQLYEEGNIRKKYKL